jgi:hypothetical protein
MSWDVRADYIYIFYLNQKNLWNNFGWMASHEIQGVCPFLPKDYINTLRKSLVVITFKKATILRD